MSDQSNGGGAGVLAVVALALFLVGSFWTAQRADDCTAAGGTPVKEFMFGVVCLDATEVDH